MAGSSGRAWTHPDVLGRGVAEGWADPCTDPTQIDWTARQRAAAIPFTVAAGRPLNPRQKTAIRHGRGELGHWGEQLAADAIVTAHDEHGQRWLVMVERGDGHGWALPGGYVDDGEDPTNAALRELEEEAGLALQVTREHVEIFAARYVPDPRATDEAWMVTVPTAVHLGRLPRGTWQLTAADDAARAEWIRADTYADLATDIAERYHGQIFTAHRAMLTELLGDPEPGHKAAPVQSRQASHQGRTPIDHP